MEQTNNISSILELYKNRAELLSAVDAPKIGWMSVSTPEEILHAAGLIPFRILGDEKNYKTEAATALLGNNTCSHLLSCLGEGINGSYDFADGIVFDDSCDMRKRLYENWCRSIQTNYCFQLEIPKQVYSISKESYRSQYRKLVASIEQHYECKISNQDLSKSIELFNSTRKRLQKLREIRQLGIVQLKSSEMIEIVKAACSGQQEAFNNKIDDFFKSVEKQTTRKEHTNDNHKVMIIGGFFDNKLILDALEGTGVQIVYEDTSTGSHYYQGQIEQDGDLLNSIADFYLDRAVGGAMMDLDKRINRILSVASDYGIQSVVYFPMKFCDRYLFNYPYLKQRLTQEGVSMMSIESEVHMENIENIKTRIETFIEMQMY